MMNRIIRVVGSIIMAILLYAIPILTTCALIFGWNDFITFLLIAVEFIELICLFGLIYAKTEEDKT